MTFDESVLKTQIEKAQTEFVNKLVEAQIKEIIRDKAFLNKAIKSLAEEKARKQIDDAITRTLENLNLQSSIDNKINQLQPKIFDMITSAVNTRIRDSIGDNINKLVAPMVTNYLMNNTIKIDVKFTEALIDDDDDNW